MKIVGFDTNVLITLKLKREPRYTKAKAILINCLQGKIKIYLPLPVLLETEWVLRSVYSLSKEKIIEFLEELLKVENLMLNDKQDTQFALNLYKHSTDVSFTDCIIVVQVHNQKVDNFLTFDNKLSKLYQSLGKSF